MKKQIRKYVLLLISLICIFNMCGCQGQAKSSNSIQLTEANYADYLILKASSQAMEDEGIYNTFEVKGVSTNFIYEEVIIEIEIFGTYLDDFGFSSDREKFSETLSVKCNVAGGGSTAAVTSTKGEVNHYSLDATYAIKSVKGRVRPAY